MENTQVRRDLQGLAREDTPVLMQTFQVQYGFLAYASEQWLFHIIAFEEVTRSLAAYGKSW